MKRQSRSEALGNAGSILGRSFGVIVIVFLFINFQASKTDSKKYDTSNISHEQTKSQSNSSESITSISKSKEYKELNYKEIAREKDGMAGEHIYIDGKVIQASNSRGNIVLRVASFNNNSEIFYVTYPEELLDFNLLEDDYIYIKGTLAGLKTYNAIFGNQVTLPEVHADSIELQ